MAETRKTVTIVFADVTGSTALGEQMDPEAMRRIMERYFAEMREVLERHGGTVEKFIGDAVMAVFGIPAVHEDDALRAVRAAAEMRDRLASLNEEFERARRVTIAVRTGVNTGEVVAGDPEGGQAFATGDAVNVAARLEQAAQPGEILIGLLTHRLVRNAVRARAVEPLKLKGKSQAAEAWQLLEVLPDVPAFTRQLDTAFVGRQQELAALREAFERARERGGAELVTVVAPAGMGKSRLARELVASVEGQARVVVGRCLPYGDGITYWPLAEIVRQVAGDDQEGLEQLLAGEEDGHIVATHLAAAVGFGEAASRSEEIAWATRRLFEALGRDRALVVVADDIHWAETTLLDLLEYVIGFAAAPVLVVCLARTDLFDTRPSWAVPRLHATTVVLEPLSDEGSQALVAGLLGGAELSATLRGEIVERAEGNPLFVEQMLAHVRESGNGEITVPPTIQGLLTARIDSLTQSEQAVIERGAVEGRLFHSGAVASLLDENEPQGIAGHLMGLVRKELIRPDQAEFAGDDGFRFVHILVRDAAYASIPKERRADFHARFAVWLEGRASVRLAEFAEIVAYHLEQAYRYRSELGLVDEETTELGRRAGEHLGAAGRRALGRGDGPAAVKLLRRALELLPAEDLKRVEFAPSLAYALFESGDATDAAAVLADASSAVSGLNAEHLATLISLHRAALDMQLDPNVDVEEILTEARAAIELFEPRGDDIVLGAAWERVRDVEWFRGRLLAARAAAEQALVHAERTGDIRLQAENRSIIGACGFFGAGPLEATRLATQEAVAWARAHGALGHEAEALHALAVCAFEGRRVEEGQELTERVFGTLEELGMRLTAAAHRGAVGVLPGERALDPEAFLERLRSSYDTLAAAGEKGVLSTVAANIALAFYDAGDYEEAERFSRESEEAGSEEDVATQVGWRAARAKVLARRGDLDHAEALAREALRRALATEYLQTIAEAQLSLGEVLRLAGRLAEAGEALQAALAIYERKGFLLSADAIR
ncbi:MAG TPA: adenylate/guanylate cyclase domain-containing protein, partial [Gaiellaceae bacterium]